MLSWYTNPLDDIIILFTIIFKSTNILFNIPLHLFLMTQSKLDIISFKNIK